MPAALRPHGAPHQEKHAAGYQVSTEGNEPQHLVSAAQEGSISPQTLLQEGVQQGEWPAWVEGFAPAWERATQPWGAFWCCLVCPLKAAAAAVAPVLQPKSPSVEVAVQGAGEEPQNAPREVVDAPSV